jgi:type IV pilus assembly protein PilB
MEKQNTKKIGEILSEDIEGTKIPTHFIDEALLKQKMLGDKRTLGQILVKDGLVSEETISEALSIQFNLEYEPYMVSKSRINWELYKTVIFKKNLPEVLSYILKSGSFPAFYNEHDQLIVMTTNPNSIELDIFLKKMNNFIKQEIVIQIVPEYAISDFELNEKSITKKELQEKSLKISKASNDEEMLPDEIGANDFLKYLLIYAVVAEASDIHIQPAANGYSRLAVRVSGIMETVLYLDTKQMSKIVASIKTQCKLDATLVKAPQDGRIDGKELLGDVDFIGSKTKKKRNFSFKEVSFRVSTYPTESPYTLQPGTSFESVVMRIFNPKAGLVRLKDLSLGEQVEKELEILKDRSQGIILITGPTGSGKSTTLYSALGMIDAIEKKIITFEDPVELRQLYWAQGQKKLSGEPKMNFDYPEAIKSMMRQDPDIILLGEIRELEGADFAFKSANTGHMVFSSLHANSSCQAFERLRKIGIDDLVMASSILAISAQRLVRKACPQCSEVVEMKQEWIDRLEKLEIPKEKLPEFVTVPFQNNSNDPKWKGKPNLFLKHQNCKVCNKKRYIGRILISEIVPMYSEIKEAVVNKLPDFEIRKIADKLGYNDIVGDAMLKLSPKIEIITKEDGKKVKRKKPGTTTIQELLRVM